MSANRHQRARRAVDTIVSDTAPVRFTRRQAYWRLIQSLRRSSMLLRVYTASGNPGLGRVRDVTRSCARLARYWRFWHRSPETWHAPSAGSYGQLRSMVSHLFDRFPVPPFMTSVWWARQNATWRIQLYLHLAAGLSIRRFVLPPANRMLITKTVARWFHQAPDDATPVSAYRWAQVRALGGDDRLARAVMRTPPMTTITDHEPFWQTVIRFLSVNRPLELEETQDIIRFVDRQKFHPADSVWGRGAGTEPIQPDLDINGRALMSIRRLMANWRTLVKNRFGGLPATRPWPQTDIRPYRRQIGETLWTIDELLSDQEIRVEAGIMQHCVSLYISDCARRTTSIWSMKAHEGGRRKRTLTIEVLPKSRLVWQAKGRRNAAPTGTAQTILDEWCAQQGLLRR